VGVDKITIEEQLASLDALIHDCDIHRQQLETWAESEKSPREDAQR
jgi:hypothetical protein